MTLIPPLGHPKFSGLNWSNAWLPQLDEPWLKPADGLVIGDHRDSEEARVEAVSDYARCKAWVWPSQRIAFLCDVHADAEAFLLGLQASGGVARTGADALDYELTDLGRETLFIIGGDCFDKGPSNLRLLRSIAKLRGLGAQLRILAGNHDVRTLLGIAYAGRKETRFAHLFVRMGKKTMRLFKEVFDEYLAPNPPTSYLSDDEVRALLFPEDSWYEEFPKTVEGLIPQPRIEKELVRIREKVEELTRQCAKYGMSLGMLHATWLKTKELFLDGGEFHWFFEELQLAHRDGSFLFVHAGVDDVAAQTLANDGVEGLNQRFDQLVNEDLFELYHGSVGNVFRTKYRPIDHPLTDEGRNAMFRAGVYAIVHGHRNILKGARLTLRGGLMNFECDASVDANTRVLEGLDGPGGAAVVFEPNGRMFAISTDYPFVRVFDPAQVLAFSTMRCS